jgi:uncharacterized membrane protein
MADETIYVYMAMYHSYPDAELDWYAVKDLHASGVLESYDAAIVNKDEDGKVHVSKTEKTTRKGAWTGVGVGAVVGVLFPPALIGTVAAGALTGGLIGHVWRGMSRKDMHELGEFLDQGDAAVVVMSRHKLTDVLADVTSHAKDHVEKEIKAHQKDVEDELEKASGASEEGSSKAVEEET